MKKKILSFILVLCFSLLCGCSKSDSTTKSWSKTSWLNEVNFNIDTLDKSKEYKISNESFSFPLDYDKLAKDNSIFILDNYSTYNDSYNHFIPFSEFYNTKPQFWQIQVYKLIRRGNDKQSLTEVVGIVSDDDTNTEYIFSNICTLSFLDIDKKFNDKNLPAYQIGTYCLAENNFVITTDISYDNALRHNANINALNNIISYFGKPTNIYSNCKYDELDTTSDLIDTYLIWKYKDNLYISLRTYEENTDNGKALQIREITFYPSNWNDTTAWNNALSNLKTSYFDLTNNFTK